MQAVQLKLNSGGQIFIGNARQRELANDHILARKQHSGRNIAEIDFTNEVGDLGSPDAGRLLRKILDRQMIKQPGSVRTDTRRGDIQRLGSMRSGDLDPYAVAKGKPALQFSRNHYCGAPGGSAGGATADCDHPSSYQRSTRIGIAGYSLVSSCFTVADAVRTTSEGVPSGRRSLAVARIVQMTWPPPTVMRPEGISTPASPRL